MLGFGIAQLVFGPLSDRFGRRAPLLVGLVIYIVCAFAATFAPNFAVLLALRFVQGMGAAGTRVIATSIVRDKFSGRAMAEVMSLTFMVFMAIPIIAPGHRPDPAAHRPVAVHLPLHGACSRRSSPLWAYFRLPETLDPANRRPLTVGVVIEGFRLVFTNRVAFFYGLAGMFLFGALFGFISTSQQIYVDIYGLGVYFPVAFAGDGRADGDLVVPQLAHRPPLRHAPAEPLRAAGLHRRLDRARRSSPRSDYLPLWLFFAMLCVIMFMFGWVASNMNSLSMEPLGAVAGTASSVFGFTQTVGGALLGTYIGQHFDGTVTPVAARLPVDGPPRARLRPDRREGQAVRRRRGIRRRRPPATSRGGGRRRSSSRDRAA